MVVDALSAEPNDVHEDPQGKDGQKEGRADVFGNEFEVIWDFYSSALMGFFEGFIHTEAPAVDDDVDGTQGEDEEVADPEVKGVHGFKVFTEPADEEEAHDGDHGD